MITTTYSPARAARRAAVRAARARFATAQNTHLARVLRKRGLVTVTQVLADHGADAELIRRYSGHAGKKVKAAHLTLTGTEPVQAWKVINGRPRRIATYPVDAPALRAGLAAYERTAHLVAA